MRCRITRAEARAFRKRWEAVSAVERRELQKTPIARKLQQLTALFAWGKYFGWTESRSDGTAEVRNRWKRLFQFYRG